MPLQDDVNQAFDIMANMSTASNDWTQLRYTYSQFKVTAVIVDSSPFLVSPMFVTDPASGFAGIREGYWEAVPTTFVVADLVRFPNVAPINNMLPFSMTKKIIGGDWFNSVATSTVDSSMPKLIFYASWSYWATTNIRKNTLRIRVYMIAKNKATQG